MNDKVTLDSLLASLEDNGLAKQASEAPQAKTATTSVGNELENMLSKQANEVNLVNAHQKGQAIADQVVALLKQASEAGNRVITETAAQVASSSAGLAETPREGNSITNTLQGLVANGIANGAVREDALDEHLDSGKDEGNGQVGLHASDEHEINATHEGSEMDDEVEKTAALIELVDNGIDFNTAVDLIKQAEEDLLSEEYEQVKQAAVAGLLNEGMDIESAVQLVKVAMEVDPDMVKSAAKKEQEAIETRVGKKVRGAASSAYEAISPAMREENHGYSGFRDIALSKSDIQAAKEYEKLERAANKGGKGYSEMGNAASRMGVAAKNVARKAGIHGGYLVRKYGPAAAVGTAAVGAVGAGVHAINHREKRAAAVEYLLGQGYDVATALALVDGE